MIEEGIIKVERRLHGSNSANKRLRKDGYLPGNIYGKGIGSIPISVKKDELGKNLKQFGRNAVFKLDLSGEETYAVVIRDIQNMPIMGGDLHVDFQKIILSKEMKRDVLIKVIGRESIESRGLIVLKHMDSIPVIGLPRKMPDAIEIDVSNLKAGETVVIGSIELPKGIICELDPEHVVLAVKESYLQSTIEEVSDKTEKE